MRPLRDMDTIQIEITNACVHDCSNCTRFCGHIKKPFMMTLPTFKAAVDSMEGFPHMVGIMGGEPLLHPQFKELCEYALSKIPRAQLGLWTALPKGYEHYADLICSTFGNIFINNHSRPDIYHAPILIGIEDLVANPDDMWYPIDKCWIQNSWSASINPNGAYFCEVAAAMSILFDEPSTGWKVEKGWWKRIPKDYTVQCEQFCPRCGLAAPLHRRPSIDGYDDISQKNYDRLQGKSRKLGKCIIGKGQLTDAPEQMAAYKDISYREAIASSYGIALYPTNLGFLEPRKGSPRKSLYSKYLADYSS